MIETADVVVIGGGVIGAACAEALSRHWRNVVLLERAGLASGTSSACQSGVGHGVFADDYDLALDRAAIDACREFAEDDASIGYHKTGALLVCGANEAAAVKGRVQALARLGLNCDWLDASAVRQVEPNLATPYEGALRLNDMGQVSPMRLVVELVRRASARGAKILTGTEVTGLISDSGRIAGVQTTQGRIATDRVVIAAGVWSRRIAKFLHLALPIWPLKGHVIVTEPLRGALRHYITEAEYEVGAASFAEVEMTEEGPRSATPRTAAVLQPLPSGQILIGSSREFADDRDVARQRLCEISQRAAKVLPLLRETRAIRSYAGLRPWTPDGRPLVGPTAAVEGLTIAAGHGGEGNTRSLITGRLIEDLLTGRTPPIDPAPLSPDRFDLRMSPASA